MKITETKHFTLTPQLQSPHRLTFLNRWGGVDCLLLTRHRHTEVKAKGQHFYAGASERTFQVEAAKTRTYFSQHLAEAEYEWLADLMVSPYVTIDARVVRVEDATYKFNTVDRVWNLVLEVQGIYPEHKLTL